MKSPLYLLDSHAIIYRAYFAFIKRPLSSPDGRNVGAVFGFFKMLLSIIDSYKPELFACVFDSRTKTFRHELYDQYKATRPKTPEDLHPQADMIEAILAQLGLPVLRQDGYEADDLIASLAELCRQEDRPCFVISGDKDLLQLVSGPIRVLKPDKEGSYRLMGRDEVKAEWSLPPELIGDYLALAGDASDNVPGVSGIGEVTATKLLGHYGSLDGIYAAVEEIKPEGIKKKLLAGRESAYFSRRLVELKHDIDLGVEIDGLRLGGLSSAEAAKVFSDLGMKTLATRFKPSGELFPLGQFAQDGLGRGQDGLARGQASATQADSTKLGTQGLPSPAATPRPESPATHYTACLEEAALSAFVDQALAAGICGFDCETDSLDEDLAELLGFSLALDGQRGIYVPLVCPDARAMPREAALGHLGRILRNPEMLVVGQNLKFDYKVLTAQGIRPTAALRDTMLAAWLLDPGRASYGLSNLAELHLGNPGISFESLVPKGASFAQVPLEKAAAYAAEDADFALRLWRIFEPALRDAGLEGIFLNLETPLIPILAGMESAGLRLDSKALRSYSKDLETELARIEASIHSLVGHDFNIQSTKQLQEVLFVERGLKPGKKTKTGYSTDTSVLEELAYEDPVPELILRHRSLAKLKNTYVDALPSLIGADGRVHSHFIQTGTATGRLSSRDPNLQNIPIRDEEGRRIREAFIAEEGSLLVSLDYSQIELVVMAHLSGDAELMQAFLSGSDVHRRTASLIFGKEEAKVEANERRLAKTINFGVIYGMSAFRLAGELKIPRGEAAGFIRAYFDTYSGVRDFIERTVKDAERLGYTSTIMGRKRRIDGINSSNKAEKAGAERVAVNSPIQGSAADIVKMAMLGVDALLKREFPNARLVLQVHDELLIECPRAQVDALKAAAKGVMEAAVGLSLPLRVEAEAAYSWGEMH